MTESNLNSKIENWKKGMFSEDWNTVLESGNHLVKHGGKEVSKFLMDLLKSDHPGIRNGAALALHDLKNDNAVDPLLEAIFKPENSHFNGTMVFALENLDCKHKLVEIFRILFYHDDESKMGAYTILNEQIFEFYKSDLEEIQKMWIECSQHKKGKGFDDEETFLMMKDAYLGFMEYLKSKDLPSISKKTKSSPL